MYKIGIDLGGTNIATGVVDDNHKIIGRVVSKTDPESTPIEIINHIVGTVYNAMAAAGVGLSEIEEIGVGIPGAVDSARGIVEYSCNLSFQETAVAAMLSEKMGKRVFLTRLKKFFVV